jgi:hypothetical protein
MVATLEAYEPPKRRTKVSGSSCFIEYTGADGVDSMRVITLHRIDGPSGNPQLIGAHCHTRDAYRTFRIDRIRSMVDGATGEELDPVSHCIALQRSGALKVEDRALGNIMTIMTFLARCDGEFHALEQESLDDIIGRYFRFFGGDDAAYECARREAMRLAPDDSDLLRAVRSIKRNPMAKDLAGFVLKGSMAMIDADGVQHNEEVYWAIELGNELKKIVTSS